MLRLFLLFTLIPAAEIAILISIGSVMGPLPTFGLLLLSGVLGAWLARREGLAVIRQLAQDVATGLPPAERLVEGALVAVGGVLLVTPGFLSDVAGLALVFPPTRRLLVPRVIAWGRENVVFQGFGAAVPPPGGRPPRPAPPAPPPSSPFDHPVA